MQEEQPLVSIIVITYNSAKYVLETLESAKAQTYQNIELILSDDGSTDSTISICKEWIEKNNWRFARTEIITSVFNTGIPANLNRGIKSSNGKYIKTIAGDDALTTVCIERYVEESINDNQKLVMFSNVIHYMNTFDEKNRLPFFETGNLEIARLDITPKEHFEILLRMNFVWAGSLFFNRKVFEIVGLFDESMRLLEDLPMLHKITKNNIKLYFINFISCKYRKSNDSVQRNNKDTLVSEFDTMVASYHLGNIHYYSPLERIVYMVKLKTTILLGQKKIKQSNIIAKVFYSIIFHISKYFLKRLNKKYL